MARVLILLGALLAAPPPAGRAGTVDGRPVEPVTIVARELARGELILIAVNRRDLETPPSGALGSRALDFYPTRDGGWAALAGFDLEAPVGPIRLELVLEGPEGPRSWSRALTVRDKSFPVRRLSVPDRYVRLSPSDEARANSEQARNEALYAAAGPAPLFSSRFASPIPGAASARFGERRVFNGQPRAPHSGADLRAGAGTPVRAPAAGRVALVDDLFFAGRTVIVDHGLGLYSVYAHLSRAEVAAGEELAAGAVLGRVGATGRVTGPHLHWAMRFKGERVDPFSVVALPLDRYLPR